MGINYTDTGDEFEMGELETGGELMRSDALVAAQAQHEIQSAITVAQQIKRNEDQVYQQFVYGSCHRIGMSLIAEYSFKRGKIKDENGKWVDNIIHGPSIKLVRELTRLWGNIRYGAIPIAENSLTRQILAYGWDLQTNTWIQQGVLFRKLVEKKDGWVEPDERELRELTNRYASIAIRNCLEKGLLPPDFLDDGRDECKVTLRKAMTDKDKLPHIKKRIIAGFSNVNVPVVELEAYLGHSLDTCSPAELETIRGIYVAIADGSTSWHSYRKQAAEPADLPNEIKRPGGASAAPAPPKTEPPKPNGHAANGRYSAE